ncbi:Protein tumorous imaginal discs, mitochondrial [Nymphon striatum]|nr:Protein tumorous imaginal discs, mitochondrial [Nymphon striatum]
MNVRQSYMEDLFHQINVDDVEDVMRFNAKELSSVALQPSHKFDKEGVLFLREKQGSYFRRADVFTERWCRLRGNLLFYFKNKDQCSEPVGVIILERCSIKVEESQDLPNLFSLVFDNDEKIQQLIAKSESERDSWIQVLHMASYEYMRSQLEGLRGKLASRCGKPSPSDTSSICSDTESMIKRPHSNSISGYPCEWLATSEPFIEINISCDNLMCDGDGTAPNPIVMMFFITPPQTQWMKFAQTEIVEYAFNTNVFSIAQDIASAVFNCRKLTSKHIGLGLALHQATRYESLVEMFHKANHTIGIASHILYLINYTLASKNTFHSTQMVLWQRWPVPEASNIDVDEAGRSSNPYFLTTFDLSRSDFIMSTRMKLAVYDVKERLTSTMTLLGQSILTVGNLLQAEKRRLRLTLISAECAGVGFITIAAKQIDNDNQSITSTIIPGNFTPNNSSPPEEAKVTDNRPRSQSLPSRLLPGWKTHISMFPPMLQLDLLCDNSVGQSYRFHTGLGAELSVQETMAETKLSALLPCLLLKFWIQEEKRYIENVTCLGNLKPEWHARQMDVLERHLDMVKTYTQAADYIACNIESGSYYKKSSDKSEINIEFMPVNFHVQRLSVRNVSTRKHGVYDIYTVGAFTAIARKVKHGGLFSMMTHFSKSPSFNGQKWATGESADALGIICEALWKLKQLRKRLLVCVETKEMIDNCDGNLVESAMTILEQARTPDNSKPINQLMESREGTPMKVVKVNDKPSSTIFSDKTLNCVQKNGMNSSLIQSSHQNVVTSHEVNDINSNHSGSNGCSEEDHNESEAASSNRNLRGSISDEQTNECINKNMSQEHTLSNNLKVIDGTIIDDDDDECFTIDAANLCATLADESYCPNSITMEPEPLDLTKLNIEASVMCMLSKVNNFSQKVSKNCLADLVPSIRKLKQAVDVLLQTMHVTNGVFALMETQQRSSERYTVRHRRDVVLSHALTAVTCGLLVRLWCTSPIDHNFLNRLHSAGALVEFEGLLSCHGDELFMIEDMIVAINDLKAVKFKIECVNNKEYSYPEPRIEGSRFDMTIVLPVNHEVYLAMPNELQTSSYFKIIPVFFNIGINEQASFAEKFGDLSLQEFINKESAAQLLEYFSQYQNVPVTQCIRGRRYNNQDIPVTELLNRLQTQVSVKKSKNTEILQLAAEICWRLNGLRFTSCKSAKDRTSMSVTLEQCILLHRHFDLDEREYIRALNCMRSEGVRRENTLKNAGVRKYAFNSLQLLTLPKLYRPPAGTFVSSELVEITEGEFLLLNNVVLFHIGFISPLNDTGAAILYDVTCLRHLGEDYFVMFVAACVSVCFATESDSFVSIYPVLFLTKMSQTQPFQFEPKYATDEEGEESLSSSQSNSEDDEKASRIDVETSSLNAVCNKFHSSTINHKKDYYEVLGISRNASQKEIKKSYYQLAKKYHPDTNKSDKQAAKKFQEISEAYEILSDESKRKSFDQFGTATDFGASSGPSGAGFGGFQATMDAEELFRKIFGDAGFKSSFSDFNYAESDFGFGQSEEINMRLSFKEAARGVNKEITVNVIDNCPKCQGSRSEPGTKAIRCPYCNGTGMETVSTGPFVMRSTCRRCHGTKMHIRYPCGECQGKGSTVQRKTVKVAVPAGVENGQTLRIPVGKREVFVSLKVATSDLFKRDGADIHTDVNVSVSQAVLGGSIKVPGIYEDLYVDIPAGTSSHNRIRLRGKGLKRVQSHGHGDHYIHVKIDIPRSLTENQKALITAYAELEKNTPGTIQGISYSTENKKVAIDDSNGKIERIRNSISGDIVKKIANEIENEPSDTKRGEMS